MYSFGPLNLRFVRADLKYLLLGRRSNGSIHTYINTFVNTYAHEYTQILYAQNYETHNHIHTTQTHNRFVRSEGHLWTYICFNVWLKSRRVAVS